MSIIRSGLTSIRKLTSQIDALRLLSYYVLPSTYPNSVQRCRCLQLWTFLNLLILGNNCLSMIKFIKYDCDS